MQDWTSLQEVFSFRYFYLAVDAASIKMITQNYITNNRSILNSKTENTKPVLDIAVDWEWLNKMLNALIKAGMRLSEYNKILGYIIPIFGTYLIKGSTDVQVVEHPTLGDNLKPTWYGNSLFMALRGLQEVEKPSSKVKVKKLVNRVTFFYAPLDPMFCYQNQETWKYLAKNIVKHRTLKTNPSSPKSDKGFSKVGQPMPSGVYAVDRDGNYYQELVEFNDLCGLGIGGLKKVAEGWGISLDDKGLMDSWKSDMLTAYRSIYPSCLLADKPTDTMDVIEGHILHDRSVQYGIGDTAKLFEIDTKSYDKVSQLWSKLGFPEYIKPREFSTIGGVTNQTSVMKLREALELLDTTIDDKGNLKFLETNERFLVSALYPSSTQHLDDLGGTLRLLRGVDGGYCKNMQPTTIRIEPGKSLIQDIDLKGCYGNGLLNQDYPLGMPIFIGETSNRSAAKPTLETFLKQHGKNLVPGLWYARISTDSNLSFEQDIIISKHFNDDNIFEVTETSEGFQQVEDIEGIDEVKGDFQLTTKAVTTGIINHDILQVLQGCSTRNEWSELSKKLKVDAAIYYHKDFELTINDFKSKYKADASVTLTVNSDGTTNKKDNLKRYWARVQMSTGWVDTLLNERDKVKKELAVKKDEQDKLKKELKDKRVESKVEKVEHLQVLINELDAEQNVCKLLVNAIYGVCGSLHYQTEMGHLPNPKSGNVVVANNITARARVGVWALQKACNLIQVITDGGAFDINNCWLWDWQGKQQSSVGLDILSRLSHYPNLITKADITKDRKLNIKSIPLGNNGLWKLDKVEGKLVTISNDVETITVTEEKLKRLDELALEHTASMFSMLDIYSKKQFKFASKDLFSGFASQSQGNYRLVSFDGKVKYKARGYKLGKTPNTYDTPDCSGYATDHPFKTMFDQIANGQLIDAQPRVYTSELLGVSDYNKSAKLTQEYDERNLLPGMNVPRSSHPRPISLSMFKWQTREQYVSWNKRHERMRDRTGYGVEAYFMVNVGSSDNPTYKLDYDKAILTIQSKINDGELWVVDIKSKDPQVIHPQVSMDLDKFH